MFESLFRSSLSGWPWFVLAGLPLAIVALYFLKLKRQPLVVPSTYLWQRTIEDLHVNSLWQRMRRSLLLFLQLLLVLLSILALLRPGWQSTELEGSRYILLVDNSASMSAGDVAGTSRLFEAKRRVAEVIDQMQGGSEAMLITFAGRPQVVQQLTDNKSLLKQKLELIQPTNQQTRILEALQLADGLANPARLTDESGTMEFDITEEMPATLYVFSDGGFEPVEGFSLGNLTPKFIPIGSAGATNVAITALTTRGNELLPDQRQAFARLLNTNREQVAVVAELYLNGEYRDAQEVTIGGGASAGVIYQLGDVPSGDLEVRLAGIPGDQLALDNIGYAALDTGRTARVLLITPGNPVLAKVFQTERTLRLAEVETAPPTIYEDPNHPLVASLAAGDYDLVVFDQCAPPTAEFMPRANTVFVGRVPPLPVWHRTEQGVPREATVIDVPVIVDWSRIHPVMTLVDLGDLDLISESQLLDPPPGGASLIDAAAGSIAAIAPRDQFEDLVLGFSILETGAGGEVEFNTLWPLRHSFPVFWLNVLEYLGGSRDEAGLEVARPGNPVELAVTGESAALSVVLPDGSRRTIRRGPHGLFQFQETDQLGVYEVRDSDEVVRRFAINLFDPAESTLKVAESLRINYVEVAGEFGFRPSRRELWRPLLLAALVVLFAEWYIYNRRAYL